MSGGGAAPRRRPSVKLDSSLIKIASAGAGLSGSPRGADDYSPKAARAPRGGGGSSDAGAIGGLLDTAAQVAGYGRIEPDAGTIGGLLDASSPRASVRKSAAAAPRARATTWDSAQDGGGSPGSPRSPRPPSGGASLSFRSGRIKTVNAWKANNAGSPTSAAADSAADGGSGVIAAAASGAVAAGAAEAVAAQKPARAKRVLLVDDDQFSLCLMQATSVTRRVVVIPS